MNSSHWKAPDIRLLAVAASLLVTLFNLLLRAVPNDDAFTYIRTAEIFLEQGAAMAYANYAWASFAVIIALLGKILPLDLFTLAVLFNGLWYALLIYAWLGIVREIDPSPRVMALAVLVILIFPQLAAFRHEVIRDAGYWALLFTALWQFILFTRSRLTRHVTVYVVCMLGAALFRVEAVIYLVLVPLSLAADTSGRRIRFIVAYLTASLLALLTVWGLLRLAGLDLWQLLTSYLSVYGGFVSEAFFPPPGRYEELARMLFNEHAADFSGEYLRLILIAGFFLVLLGNLFNGLGAPYMMMLGVGAWKKVLHMPRHVLLPLCACLLVSLGILICFLFITRFLTARYTMVLCLALCLLLPVIIDRLLKLAAEAGRLRLWRNSIAVLLLYCFLDAYVSFGIDKLYTMEAAQWARTQAPSGTVLLTNNHVVAYYSELVDDYDLTPSHVAAEDITSAETGSLVIVEYNFDMLQVLQQPEVASRLQMIAEYPAGEEPRLAIFRRNANP